MLHRKVFVGGEIRLKVANGHHCTDLLCTFIIIIICTTALVSVYVYNANALQMSLYHCTLKYTTEHTMHILSYQCTRFFSASPLSFHLQHFQVNIKMTNVITIVIMMMIMMIAPHHQNHKSRDHLQPRCLPTSPLRQGRGCNQRY